MGIHQQKYDQQYLVLSMDVGKNLKTGNVELELLVCNLGADQDDNIRIMNVIATDWETHWRSSQTHEEDKAKRILDKITQSGKITSMQGE